MKLYLSSYELGSDPKRLSKLIGENKSIAIIPNALDAYSDLVRRRTKLQQETDGLSRIALLPEEFDLRNFFGKERNLNNALARYGAVWVLGGNTFTLRMAYKESGMDEWLLNNKSNKSFVYAGYSAGICVLSPSLKGLDVVDQPYIVPDGYSPQVIWDGVGFLDFCIAPHYKSDHPESELIDVLIEYYEKNAVAYKTLRDGEVIITDADSDSLV